MEVASVSMLLISHTDALIMDSLHGDLIIFVLLLLQQPSALPCFGFSLSEFGAMVLPREPPCEESLACIDNGFIHGWTAGRRMRCLFAYGIVQSHRLSLLAHASATLMVLQRAADHSFHTWGRQETAVSMNSWLVIRI
jgi:hypothetical protein